VGEVGVFRINDGAEAYLRDITQLLNSKKWHWAFYSFREDTWAGMDYELGTSRKMPGSEVYKPNSLSKSLKAALREQ